MKALILAAGEGIRLRPLTIDCPKAMLPIGGKPLLEHLICLLRSQRITEIAINLHHQSQVITDYFGSGDRFGVQITYSVENDILGTAGALTRLRHYLTETFLVVYGDVLTNLHIWPLVKLHKTKEASITIALRYEKDVSEKGIVQLNNGGRILRFLEKPAPKQVFSNLTNTGVYVVEPEVINFIPCDAYYDFSKDLFPCLLREGVAIYGFTTTDYFIDIGTPARYRQTQEEYAKGLARYKFTYPRVLK